MQYLSHSRKIARVLKPLSLVEADLSFVYNSSHVVQWPSHRSLSHSVSPGMDTCNQLSAQSPTTGLRANFSSEAKHVENPTEAVKELHGRILDSVNVKRSMPPNAWLWSLIENCKNEDDISFLFDVLQNLRRFRLSNLRIHENFNCNLCRQVAKTCVSVGAINHGKRALWKHNVHGLTPSVASAHYLLSYALEHKDAKLMDEVMKLLKTSNLPLQPGTADLVFRICHDTDNWGLLAKYSKKFCKAGVKLRKTTFDVWMEFAAKRGDTESLWNVDKLRSETYTQHTLSGAFSCAKGFLLEHKPKEAAAVIQIICQAYPDEKKSSLEAEFKKLVNEWPVDVIKHQNEEDKKAVVASLKSDIPAMVNALVTSGLRVNVNLDELNKNEALLS
ncbi:PREDICTED: uncharacterized protein LOC104786507 isoform X2 [Camelina sativa]|uniref:Uncharacterized protein LOC104786507 isoform X2 n=1 Tax=Camelina sativa TaxID=90675 RepID=A0ABM1Q7Z2_CAMSA|nr:PREDICTED: uncharacterized protein LOC104786507 isoform X2 [Camelina sativa]